MTVAWTPDRIWPVALAGREAPSLDASWLDLITLGVTDGHLVVTRPDGAETLVPLVDHAGVTTLVGWAPRQADPAGPRTVAISVLDARGDVLLDLAEISWNTADVRRLAEVGGIPFAVRPKDGSDGYRETLRRSPGHQWIGVRTSRAAILWLASSVVLGLALGLLLENWLRPVR